MVHADYPRDLSYFILQIGKILKLLLKFLFAIIPKLKLRRHFRNLQGWANMIVCMSNLGEQLSWNMFCSHFH